MRLLCPVKKHDPKYIYDVTDTATMRNGTDVPLVSTDNSVELARSEERTNLRPRSQYRKSMAPADFGMDLVSSLHVTTSNDTTTNASLHYMNARYGLLLLISWSCAIYRYSRVKNCRTNEWTKNEPIAFRLRLWHSPRYMDSSVTTAIIQPTTLFSLDT